MKKKPAKTISPKSEPPVSAVLDKERFRLIFNSVSDPIFVHSPEGRFLEVNSAACRHLGYSRDELLELSLRSVDAPEEAALFRDRMLRLVEKGSALIETAHMARDGRRIPVEINARLITFDGQQAVLSVARDISDRRRIQAARDKSEAEFRSLFDNLTEGVALHELVFDEAGTPVNYRIVKVNPVFEKILGLARAGVAGRLATEVYGTAEPPYAGIYFSVALRRDPETFDAFYEPLKKHFHISAIPWGENGFATIFQDVTERKRDEETLLRLASFPELTPWPIVEADSLGYVRYLNPAAHHLFPELGDGKRGGFGDPWLDGLETAFTPGKGTMSRDISANGRTYEQTVYFVEHEQRIRIYGRDVSQRTQAEQALRESEERFRKIFDEGLFGIIFSTRDFRFEKVNPVFCRMLGYSEAELVGMSFVDITHRDHAGQDVEQIKKLQRGEIPYYKTEKRYVRKDGRVIWGRIVVSVIRDSGGGFVRFLGLIEDVTEKLRTDEALRSAQRMESIGILAGGIAHDFNNLLQGIFGCMEMAKTGADKGDLARVSLALGKAMNVFERSRALTQQLLTFAKGGDPVRRAQKIDRLIGEVIPFILSGSSILPKISMAPGLWPCNVDEHQLSQVLDNIVINARQSMPNGGKIEVIAANVPGCQAPSLLNKADCVRISVRDCGTGIAPEHLQHIFEPFFTTKNTGSGLGLATSYSIIRKHDGIIEVESEPGKGSVFHIYLPATHHVADEARTVDAASFQGTGNMLLMDDEAPILDAMSLLLSDMGFTVTPVADGDAAVVAVRQAHAQGTRFRLAILDLTIPGGRGGKDTVLELLAIDPELKVVATSGYAEDPVMADPAAFGFAGRLIKPYRQNEMARVIQTVLD